MEEHVVLRWVLLLIDRSHDAECYRPELLREAFGKNT